MKAASALVLAVVAGCSAPGAGGLSLADPDAAHLRILERIAGVDPGVELSDSVLFLRMSPPGRPRCMNLMIVPYEGEGVRAFTSAPESELREPDYGLYASPIR